MSDFNQSVVTCGVALALKTVTMNILQIRARILSKTNYETNFEEDEKLQGFFAPIAPYMLFGFINLGNTKETVDIIDRVNANNSVNEPLFLAMAVAVAALKPAGRTTAAWIVPTFMGARIAHNLAFLNMRTFGALPRAVCFMAGMTAMVALGVSAIAKD